MRRYSDPSLRPFVLLDVIVTYLFLRRTSEGEFFRKDAWLSRSSALVQAATVRIVDDLGFE